MQRNRTRNNQQQQRPGAHQTVTSATAAAASTPRTLLAQVLIIAACLAGGYVGIVQPARSELTDLRREADNATQRAADAERIRPVADRLHESRIAAEKWVAAAKDLGKNAREVTILLAHLEELAIASNLHVEQISPAVRQSQSGSSSRRAAAAAAAAAEQTAEPGSTGPHIEFNGCEIRVRGQWPAILTYIRSVSEHGLTAIDTVKLAPVLGGDGKQIQARISTRHAWITDNDITDNHINSATANTPIPAAAAARAGTPETGS